MFLIYMFCYSWCPRLYILLQKGTTHSKSWNYIIQLRNVWVCTKSDASTVSKPRTCCTLWGAGGTEKSGVVRIFSSSPGAAASVRSARNVPDELFWILSKTSLNVVFHLIRISALLSLNWSLTIWGSSAFRPFHVKRVSSGLLTMSSAVLSGSFWPVGIKSDGFTLLLLPSTTIMTYGGNMARFCYPRPAAWWFSQTVDISLLVTSAINVSASSHRSDFCSFLNIVK